MKYRIKETVYLSGLQVFTVQRKGLFGWTDIIYYDFNTKEDAQIYINSLIVVEIKEYSA